MLGHGAGSIHAMWLQQNSAIIEIIPKTKVDNALKGVLSVEGVPTLSAILGHVYERVVVEDDVAEVPPTRVVDAIWKVEQLHPATEIIRGGHG